MNKIITFILTHEQEDTFIKHIKGIIDQADDTPNFFLIYRAKILLSILSNFKDGSKFRLLIHLGSKRSTETGVSGGNIANSLKNNEIFSGLKFDFTTRDVDTFKNQEQYIIDSHGNVIHNASEMDSTIIDRMILYEVKGGKALGSVKIDNLTGSVKPQITKIAIMTALDLEMKEVKRFLSSSKRRVVQDPEKQIYYEVYTYQNRLGKNFDIFLKVSGKQNFQSSSATTDMINHENPIHLFYLGIAGRLKDVEIGDVVIADRVENYEPGKVNDASQTTRIFQGHADSYLLSLATSITTEEDEIWQKNIKVMRHETIQHSPGDIKGRIATGEKVLNTITHDLYLRIRQDCSDSLAIECEGGGFYHACNEKNAKGLLIRGISDKLKDKIFVEEHNSQPYASSCAAAFLFELIDRL